MKTLSLPCGHKRLPPAIVEILGDDIDSVYCDNCKTWYPYSTPRELIKDRTIPLFATDNESPYDYIMRHCDYATLRGRIA